MQAYSIFIKNVLIKPVNEYRDMEFSFLCLVCILLAKLLLHLLGNIKAVFCLKSINWNISI